MPYSQTSEQFYSVSEFQFVYTSAMVGKGCHYALATEISQACVWMARYGVGLNNIVAYYLEYGEKHNGRNSVVNQALRAADALRVTPQSQQFYDIDDPLLFTALLATSNVPSVYLPTQKLFLDSGTADTVSVRCWQPLPTMITGKIDILLVDSQETRNVMFNTPKIPDQQQSLYHRGLPLQPSVWHAIWRHFSSTLAPASEQSACRAGSGTNDND